MKRLILTTLMACLTGLLSLHAPFVALANTSIADANAALASTPIEHVIKVGFIIEPESYDNQIVEKLREIVRLSNERTYNPLGIDLQISFTSGQRRLSIQTNVKSTADIISQGLYDLKEDLHIIDSTETDALFYILSRLPNDTCGSAQIPTIIEHFDTRLLLGVMENDLECMNPEVFSHEVGHLFGAHHDPANDLSASYLRDDAQGCLLPNNRGSLMSYAPVRSPNFSNPSFCKNKNVNNEVAVKAYAPLVATLYERHKANHTKGTYHSDANADSGSSSGGDLDSGSLQLTFLVACLYLCFAKLIHPARQIKD